MRLIFFGIIFLSFTIIIKPCTIGVAIGKVTADGRPLLWKTRDYEVKSNIVFYTKTDKYSFLSNITPEYGYSKSWFGLNEMGFAIVNSDIRDYPDRKNGPDEGEFINEALKYCITVKDFQNMLDSTNHKGRNTKAFFGVIDKMGGAVIFEVYANNYRMFDANDKSVAPEGFIVKTNFSSTNGAAHGIERYKRSTVLINNFIKGDSLNVKNILQFEIRDMADSAGIPVKLPIMPDSKYKPDNFLNCKKNICNPHSICATVIQGVKQTEPAYLSTMWTMLGNPFTAVAIPYWPVGQTPAVSGSGKGCPLFNVSIKLKKLLFSNTDNKLVNIKQTLRLRNQIIQIEDSVITSANIKIGVWRNYPSSENEMLNTEKLLAEYAHTKLLKIYSTRE